jgi:hypothetical protein
MNSPNNTQVAISHYDPHLIPAETAARQQREGKRFGRTPREQANHDHTTVDAAASRRDGYTVDGEGLLNNYAIKPEMYINVPGDLRQKAAQQAAERARQLQELSEDEDGQLTIEHDWRHQGPGLI